jgi:hypothetical protein
MTPKLIKNYQLVIPQTLKVFKTFKVLLKFYFTFALKGQNISAQGNALKGRI